MHDFCRGGAYGRWFDGRCTLDIESDEFVVLELEELRAQPELFNVVMIQIINYVTENLYLSNREQPRIHLFDEAWQWADEGSMIGVTIERGYRLARKYYGSFITVFQSLLDLKKFGKSADVMIENSAWLFLLMGKNYEKVQEEGFLTLNDFEMEILKSAKLVKGKYSEVFIKTIFNSGIARLPNDLYSHLISTSDPVDNKMISDVAIQFGITQLEAIKHISEQQNIH
jgi:conjugal transfer ATP-binding protein TraC